MKTQLKKGKFVVEQCKMVSEYYLQRKLYHTTSYSLGKQLPCLVQLRLSIAFRTR